MVARTKDRSLAADGLLKSGLKLVGAKTGTCKDSVRSKVYKLIPPGNFTYIEPFLGSGAVLVGKEPHSFEFANDINPWTINFFRQMQEEPEALWRQIQQILKGMSKEKFMVMRKFLREGNGFLEYRDGIPAAATFYAMTKVTNNGILRSNSAGENNSTFCGTVEGRGFFDADWFWKVRQRIQNTSFTNLDYVDFLDTYASSDCIGYFDPPYKTKFTQYYKGGWKDADHHVLAWLLKEANFKWILSYNDHPFVRDLYRDCNIITIETHWSVSNTPDGRGKKPELLITNFEASL